jgi:hypothetical protein
LQTVTTPVTATTISSSTFGIPVANNLTVLANPPIAKLRNSAGISITTGVSTALTWDTEDFDTVGGHSTVTNTSRYTCQTGYAGYHRIKANVYWAANASGARSVWFRVNGTDVAGSEATVLPGAATIVSVASDTIVNLAAADYVEVIVNQSSGGALATTTAGASSFQQSWFEVQWIHQ